MSRARWAPAISLHHRGAIAALSTLLACGIWVAGAHAGPATYYASPTSSASGPCTASAPCRLDHAVQAAAAGDDVIVLPGTYSITYNLMTNRAIRLEGQPGQPRPTLIGGGSLHGATLSVSGGAVVRNLTIEATGDNDAALSINGGTAENLILVATASDNLGEALDAQTSPSGSIIRTVLARSQSPIGTAVLFRDGGGPPGSASVYNLTAIGEGSTTPAIWGSLSNGTVWVKDSIASGRPSDISTQPGSRAINITHSDFRTNGSSGYVDQGGNISATPVFVNSSAGDFHEAPASPTIDSGSPDPALSATDLDGNPRTYGQAPDMGAYEYVPASGPGTSGGGTSGGGKSSGGGSGGGGGIGGAHQQLPRPSPPVVGVSVTLSPVSGRVEVKLPGSNAFVPLVRASQVPVGSIIDTTAGKVLLTSAVNNNGGAKTGAFSGGRFLVRQPRGRRPQTDLRLVGGSFAVCSSGRARARAVLATMARRPPRSGGVVRHLWGSDSGGRFVTVGRSASATVRGTVWVTQDRCDGTLIRVVRGAVIVHAQGHRRSILLGPGQSYLARARR